jgi:nucleoside-diphosphate-sugar epimerase
MQRILIVGTNSFVGNSFLRFSKFKEIEQISLINNIPENIDFKGIDIVIHLAAIVHQSKKIPDNEYFKINTDLCLRVAKLAKSNGVKQFIFMSTVKVYGDNESLYDKLDEESPCKPCDAYGRSKLAAEIALQCLNEKSFTVSIVRTPLIYGEGVKANMLNLFKLVDNFFILPLKDIRNKRSFNYIENLVGFIDRIIEKNVPGIFIAMDSSPLSTTELITLISNGMDKKLILLKIPGNFLKIIKTVMPELYKRLFTSFELDNQKTLKTLDYSAPFTSEEGIKRTVKWYRLMYSR